MNHVLHFRAIEFFEGLKASTTAYVISFSLGTGENKKAYVLVTTDNGVEGGTVHAIQIQILTKQDDPLEQAGAAAAVIGTFLQHKDVKLVEGIVSTAGLQETLQKWGHVVRLSLSDLGRLLNTPKKTSGRRRNQNNK